MYVEAICPLCFATHVVDEDMRGRKYRCEECEELFIVSKKAKRTSKKPPRPREVLEADDAPAEAELLPEAKLTDRPGRKPTRAEDEVLEIPDEAMQPVGRRRSREDEEDDDRPRSRRRPAEDDRPARRPAGRSSGAAVLVVLLVAGGVMLLGGALLLVVWLLWPAKANAPAPQAQAQAANNPLPDPPKADAPPAKPPQVEVPPPKPPLAQPPADWPVRADPPPVAIMLPADVKTGMKAPGLASQLTFPTSPSPYVAMGANLFANDERQVWNLQTGTMTGKISGVVSSVNGAAPVLSPDGAYLAYYEKLGTVAVWTVASGKKVEIEVGPVTGFLHDYIDFAGNRLLTLRKTWAVLQFQLWNLATGARELTATPPGRVSGISRDAVALSPGGNYLAVASREKLQIIDLRSGTTVVDRPLPKWDPSHLYSCHALSFSPDGGELAALYPTTGGQAHLICWDLTTGQTACDFAFALTRPHFGVLSVYRGHALDWLGQGRGWLLYGYTLIDRSQAGQTTALPQPPVLGTPDPRHLVGFDHVVTLAAGTKPNEKVLAVTRFNAAKPGN